MYLQLQGNQRLARVNVWPGIIRGGKECHGNFYKTSRCSILCVHYLALEGGIVQINESVCLRFLKYMNLYFFPRALIMFKRFSLCICLYPAFQCEGGQLFKVTNS